LILLAQGALAACAIAAVAYPLFSRKKPSGLVPSSRDELEAQRDALLEQKQVAYETIKELELDWTSGKLSEEDYQTMRREIEQEAIQVLKELDTLEDLEATLREEPEDVRPRCPECGHAIEPTHAFCPSCGTKTS
jgi:rubrerythrin